MAIFAFVTSHRGQSDGYDLDCQDGQDGQDRMANDRGHDRGHPWS